MTLDSHLHNLIAQYINADGDATEQHRLAEAAMSHLKERSPHVSRQLALRTWAILIDALSIE